MQLTCSCDAAGLLLKVEYILHSAGVGRKCKADPTRSTAGFNVQRLASDGHGRLKGLALVVTWLSHGGYHRSTHRCAVSYVCGES